VNNARRAAEHDQIEEAGALSYQLGRVTDYRANRRKGRDLGPPPYARDSDTATESFRT
jgi:hypothetical protein